MKAFNTEVLKKAILQLDQGVRQSAAVSDNELMRDGVIQRFEYTLDLSWKLIQRYLKHIAEVDESLIYSKKDLFREAAKLKLIDDAAVWIAHYEARNQTSRDYHRDKANMVYEQAKLFLNDVKNLARRFDELG